MRHVEDNALELANDGGIVRVIESDPQVRAMLTASLVAMGVSVIPLDSLDHDTSPVSATLVDVSLLRRSRDWAGAYLRLGGPLVFLLSTVQDEFWLTSQLGLVPSNVLRKPFRLADLARSIREVADRCEPKSRAG